MNVIWRTGSFSKYNYDCKIFINERYEGKKIIKMEGVIVNKKLVRNFGTV